MNKYLMIITVVVMVILSACSSGDESQRRTHTDVEQLPIKLGTSIGYETRSNTATNLLNGDTVYVWTDMINGATQAVSEYFKAWALKANGVGGLSTLEAGNTKLFPATNSLHFYAMVGNFGKETDGDRAGQPMIDAENSELPTTGIRHTVLNDQSTPEAYYKSDLLYAVIKNQEPISHAVVLPFKHLLSRVQVVLVAGNGMTASNLSSATVKLLNMKRQIAFNPDKEADFSSQSALASMLSWSNLFQTSDILMATSAIEGEDITGAATAGSTVYADAIVVPQTIEKGANFIQVSYLGRDTYYRIPNGTSDEPLVLESGKQYRFRLIANRIGSGYQMTVTVSDWDVQAGEAMWVE